MSDELYPHAIYLLADKIYPSLLIIERRGLCVLVYPCQWYIPGSLEMLFMTLYYSRWSLIF